MAKGRHKRKNGKSKENKQAQGAHIGVAWVSNDAGGGGARYVRLRGPRLRECVARQYASGVGTVILNTKDGPIYMWSGRAVIPD